MKKAVLAAMVFALLGTACGGGANGETLTIYSGRSEDLIAPLIDEFRTRTGYDVEVRYGDSAELAATLLQEGGNSPADVFFAQDPASLGVVALADGLLTLDGDLIDLVPARFSDSDRRWVGVSGRARVVVYDTSAVDPATLPVDEDGFTATEWAGRVAIAPTNGSFLAFVATKILVDGEEATVHWLEGMAANRAPTYPRNSVIVAAVDDGEVDVGLVNHYYLFRRADEVGDVIAGNHFLAGASAASLVMPAGAGVVAATDNLLEAEEFLRYLLSVEAQTYFAESTYEYPLASGVAANPALPSLASLSTPDIDLSELASVLDRATDLVAEAGLL